MTQKTSSSFTICHTFASEKHYFPVLLSVRSLLTRLLKRNKRKVVSGSRVTLPVHFACKRGLSFNPLARVTLAVGLPYPLVKDCKQGLRMLLSVRTNNSWNAPKNDTQTMATQVLFLLSWLYPLCLECTPNMFVDNWIIIFAHFLKLSSVKQNCFVGHCKTVQT